MNKTSEISREQFLEYFRSDRYSQDMNVEDCLEVFLLALKGSSDLTTKNLSVLFEEYGEIYPVPALVHACVQVIEQNDCKCDKDYSCSICACMNALEFANR